MHINPQTKEMLQTHFGLTENDFNKITPNIIKLIENMGRLSEYKFVVEATSSSLCSAGIKEGDKFVFNAMPIVLLPEESTASPCMRALAVLTPFLNTMADRIVDGLKAEDSIWSFAECMDPGLGNGGFGKVKFKFSTVAA